ncbi:MAG: T9SS type A sorting domain-containing protein [Chitinophagales bacterium]
MKILYTLLLFCAALFLGLALTLKVDKITNKPKGFDSPLSRLQWEHSRRADPATGEIPSMGVWKAFQQLVATGKIPSPPYYSNTTRNAEWQQVNDFFATLAVTKITYDPLNPQIFYFCTGEGWYGLGMVMGAGVWKSEDAGNSWNQLLSTASSTFDYCQDIDVHPFTADVYVATHAGLMRSKDGGQTWQPVLIPPGSLNHGICDVEFTRNGGIFATSGIFESGAIYYSDSGDSATWVKQTNGFPASGIYRVELATAPSNDSVAYAVACSTDYSIKDIYKTIDKGNTWTALNFPDIDSNRFANYQAWYDLILAVDPNDEHTIAGGGWHFFRSKDGGNTWLRISHGNPDSAAYQYVHVDEHAIVFRNSDTVYFGCDGGVWKSGDFTSDYPVIYDRNNGYRVTQYYAADLNPEAGSEVIIGGTQDNGSNKMVNSGISPEQNLTWYDGGFCAINQQNPIYMYTTKNSNGTFRFTNGGYGVADTITNPYLTDGNVQFINPIALDKTNGDILYMVSGKGLWRLTPASTANDSDWVQASKYLSSMSAIGVSTSHPHTVFAGRAIGGNIYRLENADTSTKTHSWIDCDPSNQLPSGGFTSNIYCNCVYVDPADVNHVFATYTNFGIKNVWETKNATDASPVWSAHDGDLPDMAVYWIFPHPAHPEVCYIGTDLGVFYTTQLNGDNTQWLPGITGMATVPVYMLTYRPSDQTLLAATYGRGLFTGTVPMDGPDFSITWNERGPRDVGGRTRAIMIDPNDSTGQTIWAGSVSGGLWKTTAIDQISAVGISPVSKNDLSLSVFPNPVTEDGTGIRFSLISAGVVSLFIYDEKGIMIETLLQNKKMNAGNHHLYWSPDENNGSGIYYLSLMMEGKQVVTKIACFRK